MILLKSKSVDQQQTGYGCVANLALVLLILANFLTPAISSDLVERRNPRFNTNPFLREEIFGPKSNYQLQWAVDLPKTSIIFDLAVECKGFAALGLSRDGLIPKSDFVVGGIKNGKPYLNDLYGESNGNLQQDKRQDWKLISGNITGNWTYLKFSRRFSTNDKQHDIAINDDMVYLIWASGNTNDITLSKPYLGYTQTYLLDPDYATVLGSLADTLNKPNDVYSIQLWSATATQKIPPEQESQICSIIRGPEVYYIDRFIQGAGKYYAYGAANGDKYVRQITLSRCTAPADESDSSAYFEKYVNSTSTGVKCTHPSFLIPITRRHVCSERYFVLGERGKAFYFPPELGFTISENNYFMIQVHYSNPQKLQNLQVKSGLALVADFLPQRLSPGIIKIGLGSPGTFPVSSSLTSIPTVQAQCFAKSVKESTTDNYAENGNNIEGFNVYAVLMVMGRFGKSMSIKHFRKNRELPVILSDGNYDSHFQQIRSLRTNVAVLDGDKITIECKYDVNRPSQIQNSTTTAAAEQKTAEEECTAYLYTDRPISEAWCANNA